MPRKSPTIDLDYFRQLRAVHKPMWECAECLGVQVNQLYTIAKKNGISTHMSGENIRRSKTRVLPADEIAARYEAGESAQMIGQRFNIGGTGIKARLRSLGMTLRTGHESQLLRMKREGPEGRKRLTEAAHAAMRGTTNSNETMIKRAGKSATMHGHGEDELADRLRQLNFSVTQQAPCGKYNIDIAVGTVAVEISCTSDMRYTQAAYIERAKYLVDFGYSVIEVEFREPCDLFGNFNDVVSLIEQTCRTPARIRKNWVIRCNSERFARGRNNLGQITAVPVPERFFYTTHEWDLG